MLQRLQNFIDPFSFSGFLLIVIVSSCQSSVNFYYKGNNFVKPNFSTKCLFILFKRY